MTQTETTRRISKTSWALIALLLLLLAVPALCGVTLWTIEHYMDITPADWPEAGGFWDRANDFTCGMILLPSGVIGRFFFWLLFFPVPISIALYQRNWRRATIFVFCVLLPYSYADILMETPLSSGPLYNVLVLLLLLVAPPFLIQTWSSPAKNRLERRLLRADLAVIWLTFCAADIMLGINIHSDYCKVSITTLLSK